ncbi:gp012 [Erwinia phage vB_EamP-S6]|uniref:Gp012 n=1 Tax=Erwinia phage vB_EamP-S6 TaxID=1051675 RepID=G0YQA4_9CAUD|nr:gp012 [Erwinia phage vB_EamP-S6]AEJ81531.1 gp012 [Erwinia phage vB_EamP-S6]
MAIDKPPLSRLVWVVYNTLGGRKPHPVPLGREANELLRTLQTPYWRAYRMRKYGH